MQDYEFTVVVERDEDGRFLALCPALQGCYTGRGLLRQIFRDAGIDWTR